jgi:hypothetical protein
VGKKKGDFMAKNKDVNEKIKEDPRFKEEITKLSDLFKDIGEEKKTLVYKLIENAGFMAVLLEDLQLDIKANGYKDKYQNGETQFGYKRSIAADLYQVTIKNYSNTIKLLSDLLGVKAEPEDDDGFNDFINSRNDM